MSLLLLMMLAGCASGPRCPGLPGAPPLARAAADDADWHDLDEALRGTVDDACLPAMGVAVVDGSGVRYAAAAGWADIDAERAIDADSPFLLASASKLVLGLALVEAEADGAVTLDDPVQDHIGFTLHDPRGGDAIRLSHLATHSSGIRDNWNVLDDHYTDGDPDLLLADFMAGHLSEGGAWATPDRSFARWDVGEGSTYSNVGASLAALAVEGAVGEDYADWTTDRFFAPLGMEHTGWFLADLPADAVVASPTTNRGDRWKVHDHYGFPTYPDGLLRASAGDLGQLLALVLADGGDVLAPGAVDRLLSEPHPELRSAARQDGIDRQRVVWFDLKQGGRTLTGHDGSETGATSRAFIDRETGVGAVVLVNTDTPAAERAADEMLETLLAAGAR